MILFQKTFAGIRLLVDRTMRTPTVYNLWQAPFAEQKFAPILKHAAIRNVRRVLDVGCGPGTNTSHFEACEYLGLDLNHSYIEYARRRYKRQFIVADVCEYIPEAPVCYDFILVNSFLHHVDDDNVSRVLSKLNRLLHPGGHIHILELVRPDEYGVARVLAEWDRGQFARPVERWHQLFSEYFVPVVYEPYVLGILGATLWKMVYFQGRAR